jgi:hypothetical protein
MSSKKYKMPYRFLCDETVSGIMYLMEPGDSFTVYGVPDSDKKEIKKWMRDEFCSSFYGSDGDRMMFSWGCEQDGWNDKDYVLRFFDGFEFSII